MNGGENPEPFFSDIRRVAVVGASDDASKLRGRLVRNLLAGGFKGDVYPVTKSAPSVAGLPAFGDLTAVPHPVDLALVAVPAVHVAGVIDQAASGAARSLVVFSAGIDIGSHAERIGPGRLRIIGPNTEGFYLPDRGLAATFAPAIDGLLTGGFPTRWPGRRIFIVSQSGGLGFALFARGVAAMLNFRGIVTTGNEADMECLEIVDALLSEDDPPVIVIAIEGLKEPSRLAEVGRKAALVKAPIIVLKAGSSTAGARAVESHTAHLAGGDAAYDAMFDRLGIIRVHDAEELMATCAILSTAPVAPVHRAAIVTTSGGAGVWLADLCGASGVDVPRLGPTVQDALRPLVPAFGSTANPVDVTAQAAEGSGAGLYDVAEVLAASEEVDCVIINQGLSKAGRIDASRERILQLQHKAAPKPVLFHSHIAPSEENCVALAALGLHAYPSVRACAVALRSLTRYAEFAALEPELVPEIVPRAIIDQPDGVLGFAETEALFASYGLPTPISRVVTSGPEALSVAAQMDGELVLKIVSDDIPHKTEAGGVVLGVAPKEAGRAFEKLVDHVRSAMPGARIQGVQVQALAPPGFELAVGILRDPGFGPLVMLASGGIYIEILADAVLCPPPISRDVALRMIRRLRCYPILAGARGRPALDTEAIADLLCRVGRMAGAEAAHLEQLDLNPVRVYTAGKGVLALDALAVIRAEECAHAKH
jgi:acetyltransferase